MGESILIGRDPAKGIDLGLSLRMANRHGLIAGATGTGKTISLQVLAEAFARNGVPVFLADVKGDLSGISQIGGDHPKAKERAAALGLKDWQGDSFPVLYWDLFGSQGHPIRTTVSEMGPLLLDIKDLRAILQHVGENASEISTRYGNVAKPTIGTIQRQLLMLENQGAE